MDNLPLDKYTMSELQTVKQTLNELRNYCHTNAIAFPDKVVVGIVQIILKNEDYKDYYANV